MSDETQPLLNSTQPPTPPLSKSYLWNFIRFISVAIALTILGLVVFNQKSNSSHLMRRNVILLVPDGFGPASETFSRTMFQRFYNKTFDEMTPLDEILVGTSRTRSSSSLVTDSAAGATAFSCGLKTYNAAIGVDSDRKACGTVLEAAKMKGFKTGLAVTSRITHATPASFSSHIVHRDLENEIALQQIGLNSPLGRVVDVMFGGGLCHFLPNNGTDRNPMSCRDDSIDVLQLATEKGFHILTSKEEFDNLNIERNQPVLGLFGLDHLEYVIDRDYNKQPSLKSMAMKAIGLLEEQANQDDSPGFFLLIEGSRIDMAAHSNDAPAHAHEILEFHETIQAVKEYVEKTSGAVMIAVADHETGGLSLSKQLTDAYPEYKWNPQVVERVKMSSFLAAEIIVTFDGNDRERFVLDLLKTSFGILDASLTEIEYLKMYNSRSLQPLEFFINDMINRRSQLGWATHGHSGVDVNLYAFGNEAEQLRGNHENTDIGEFIVKYLGLDLDEVTEKLEGMPVEPKLSPYTKYPKARFHRHHFHRN